MLFFNAMYIDREGKGLQSVSIAFNHCLRFKRLWVNLEKMSSLIKLKYADMVNLNTPFRKTFSFLSIVRQILIVMYKKIV